MEDNKKEFYLKNCLCNAEVTRPPITWPTNLILHTVIPRIESTLASRRKEVLRVLKSRRRSSWMLEHKLTRRLFADQRLSYSGVGGARVVAHALQSHRRSRRSGERKGSTGRSWHDSCDVNISSNPPLLPGVAVDASYQAGLVTCQG